MPKSDLKTKQVPVTFHRSTKGTHVYKQDPNEGRHQFYFDRAFFNGEPPQALVVTVTWK